MLSEWKFFVRGLAAYYRHEPDDMKANWDRLDPRTESVSDRTAAARALAKTSRGQRGRAQNTEALEKLAFGEPVLDRLISSRGLAAAQEWDKVIRLLGPLRHALGRIDRRLARAAYRRR